MTRPAVPQDVDFLAQLFLTSMRDWITAARGHWDPDNEIAQFRRQLEISGTRVVRVDLADVGFVTTRRIGPGLTEIHTLCVAEGWQGHGIGTQVMRELMRDAEATGTLLELSVLKANHRARVLYARLGFVEVGESSHHVRMRWPTPV